MTMRPPYRASDAELQQRAHDPASRQQQQDNGTHEFQPVAQQGDGAAPDDRPHTLDGYLRRARQLGDLPMPRAPGSLPQRRAELRLAK